MEVEEEEKRGETRGETKPIRAGSARTAKGNYPQRQNVARANNDRPLISPTFYLKSTGKTSLVSICFTTWVPQGFFLAHVVALH